jgi:16S rRNA (adenine(1408)-N(1))-methyltransferase
MAEASRRAARSSEKGGLPNAVFVAAGVEMLPHELAELADLVTVRFPWGSLLRGALGLDGSAAASIARLVAPAGALEITVSVEQRDTIGRDQPASTFGEWDLERIRRTYDSLGLQLCDVNLLDPERIDDLHSSWARRLRVDRDRRAWSLRLERADGPVG